MKKSHMFEIQYRNYFRKYSEVYRDFNPKEKLNDEQNKQKASKKTIVEVKEEENPFTIIGKNSCETINADLTDGS